MNNSVMASVRIPSSLVKELKTAMKKDHFLDLSEAVRSIIRNKWVEERDPSAYQMKKLRSDITNHIRKKNQESLLFELQDIMNNISKNEK